MAKWNLVSYINQHFGLDGTPWAMVVTVCGILVCMLIPYLLGSLNFGLIISRKKYNDDIRRHGSGNAGSTNMLRTYGKGAAAATLVGDMLKAVVAVAIGYFVFNIDIVTGDVHIQDKTGAAIAGLFVMLGHMFPCFYGFKGGKGVATAAMVVLMINPIVFLVLCAVFVIIVAGTKFVSLGSIIGLSLYPVVLTAFDGPGTAALMSVPMACLVVFMHRENIKRLREGKESKVSFGKGKKQKKVKEEPVQPAPDPADEAEDSDDNYTVCEGCKRLIPISRKVCVYCNTKNEKYVEKK